MALSEVIHPNKIRLPWSLRGKVEVGPLQLVGQNALGLPYVQGQIRNRSGRPLHLKIVVRVLNEQRQPIFAGSPGTNRNIRKTTDATRNIRGIMVRSRIAIILSMGFAIS